VKKVTVTVEFIANLPDEIDPESVYTSIRDVGDVVRFEAVVEGERKVVATATDYETISASVLQDVYQDDESE
jgi:hypothetical protein